jgi:hypothetical protein
MIRSQSENAVLMASLSSISTRQREQPRESHHHIWPVVLSTGIGAVAIAAISYLLWPTWTSDGADGPTQLPISVGGTLFNVPTESIRIKMQRRSGPQERVDLNFTFSRHQAEAQAEGETDSAETTPDASSSGNVIFLSIAAHNGVLSPDERLRTIYPGYLAPMVSDAGDGLTVRPFRDNSPYATEDLFVASSPALAARCTRDGETPGTCLSDIRIGGADLTFRFPRSWLNNWHEVSDSMNQIVTLIHKPR